MRKVLIDPAQAGAKSFEVNSGAGWHLSAVVGGVMRVSRANWIDQGAARLGGFAYGPARVKTCLRFER